VCGMNDNAHHAVQTMTYPENSNVAIFSLIEAVHKIMDASDRYFYMYTKKRIY